MSSKKETTYYMELQPGDAVQDGDQWLDSFGQWQPYVCKDQISGVVFSGVKARRPIRPTHQTAYEEVPGSRTTQQAINQPQRERIAYEELQPGDVIQPGDEWQNDDGRWQPLGFMAEACAQVRDGLRARRPYRVNTIIIDALADAHAVTAQLQDERDKAQLAIAQVKAEFNNQAEVLAEVRADEKRLFDDLELLRSEYAKLQDERDELKAALRECGAAHRVTMEQGLQACKERDEALAELAQAREGNQQLLKTIAENADMFGDHTKALVQERDEARSERDKLKGLIDDLLDEPTAKQVQDMLRTWATELDWSAGCFDSVGREQIDTIQKTLVAVIERIEGMIHPEGGTDDN